MSSSCETNSYSYNSSPILGTSHQIEWQGSDIACIGVCKGMRLTTVQTKMANAICDLLTATSLTDLVIPSCFTTAFDTSDPILVDFLNLLLSTACTQQGQITELTNNQDTVNPFVTVDYKCCGENPCVTTGTVRLNIALENIIQCICDLKALVGTLPENQTSVVGYIQAIQGNLNVLTGVVNTYTTSINVITDSQKTISDRVKKTEERINCIIDSLDSTPYPTGCSQI
jgi:hypothetical protein